MVFITFKNNIGFVKTHTDILVGNKTINKSHLHGIFCHGKQHAEFSHRVHKHPLHSRPICRVSHTSVTGIFFSNFTQNFEPKCSITFFRICLTSTYMHVY